MMNPTKRQAIADRVFQDRARRPELLKQRAQRQRQGREIAQQAAQILKTEFGVQRVVISTVPPYCRGATAKHSI